MEPWLLRKSLFDANKPIINAYHSVVTAGNPVKIILIRPHERAAFNLLMDYWHKGVTNHGRATAATCH
ncbi:hypothetical protein NIE88_02170 [Sporolactobacillus shoreicorticis]|uniref:Uncharacterized protein n=1 Tax=Sporolactobacillus shoreicorticis TaxID=1923877 RepID=A0ABW5S1N7_9BACL|nr:hypothetical protein [Sporolactobacillus shoreicorticis]MCO7124585.1 hypothetical protein [Sporolactobacillus shoreicorticis]